MRILIYFSSTRPEGIPWHRVLKDLYGSLKLTLDDVRGAWRAAYKYKAINDREHLSLQISRPMGKPTICICENKAKLISPFGFASRIVQSVYFLNTNFPVSNHLLCLYRSVCVAPARKPHRWLSHEAAQMCIRGYH